jgi:hypothetical protein
VGVAAARVGHSGEELFVEVGPEADGRRRDAVGASTARERDERLRLGDADVREPVGEEQDRAVPVRRRSPQVLEPAEPAAREVRLPAGLDRGDGGVEAALSDRRERPEQTHLVVVGGERELVLRAQAPDEPARAALGDGELVAGHRAGAVEHEREPKRRPRVGLGRGRHRDLDHDVDVVLALEGEHGVFEADAGVHVAPFGVLVSSRLAQPLVLRPFVTRPRKTMSVIVLH